jgi:hypothetical protein
MILLVPRDCEDWPVGKQKAARGYLGPLLSARWMWSENYAAFAMGKPRSS